MVEFGFIEVVNKLVNVDCVGDDKLLLLFVNKFYFVCLVEYEIILVLCLYYLVMKELILDEVVLMVLFEVYFFSSEYIFNLSDFIKILNW